LFDKRGTGLSDPVAGQSSLEERMEDLHAVLDAAGSERPALLGISEGGPMSVLFAATYPERVAALALYGTFPTGNPERAPAALVFAEGIPGSRLVELEGNDHIPWFGDADALLDEIEEFLTGCRHAPEPDRALATVLFTDIAGSTERAAALGDRRWRELLERHQTLVRDQLGAYSGREVKTMGDGFLATFDGPAK